MNPHRLTWGFAQSYNFAALVAVATLAGFLVTRDRKPLPGTPEVVLMIAFWIHTVVTTVFAAQPLLAWEALKQFSKILLMNVIMLCLFQDRRRLRLLVLVGAISIGFYGLKGGVWGLFVSAGEHRVWGPAGTFIEDNNALALALNMALPFLFFAARGETRLSLRWLLRLMFGFSIVAVLLTYSRGGLLGLAAVLAVLMLRSRWKWLTIPSAVGAGLMLMAFLPDRWFDRMNTLAEYERDTSAMSRIWAWGICWQLALESPLVGGGFSVITPEIWKRFMPDYHSWHNAHSIYFQVLAEHGFTGLMLFCGLLLVTLLGLPLVRRRLKSTTDGRPLINLSYAVEAALIAFAASGAFLNLAYFDFVYFVIGIAILLRRLADDPAPAEATRPSVERGSRPVPQVVWRVS
jgi:probable O-glycosylation ligase (exosortase A-associated)